MGRSCRSTISFIHKHIPLRISDTGLISLYLLFLTGSYWMILCDVKERGGRFSPDFDQSQLNKYQSKWSKTPQCVAMRKQKNVRMVKHTEAESESDNKKKRSESYTEMVIQ
jgi:hypothetical protein